MYLNMLIPAIIGILSFSLAMLPNDYYQTPMVIIGKFYGNSMLVLINSRMLLGSELEETLSTILESEAIFTTEPANDEDYARGTWRSIRRSYKVGETFENFRA